MNPLIKKIVLAVPVILWAVKVFAAPAEFLDLDPGARPTGMGSAFTALADDGNTQLFNPAGLANLGPNAFQASGSFSFLTLGRLDDYLAASQQVAPDSYLGFYVDHYQVDVLNGLDLNGLPVSGAQDLELALGANYAYDFGYDLKAGFGASFLYQDLSGTGAKGFGGVDLGFLFVPTPLYDFTLGASVRQLGGFIAYATGTSEMLDPDLRLGAGLKLAGQAVALAYDAEWRMDGAFNVIHHVGAEVYPWPSIGLRGGMDGANPSFGATVKLFDYVVDYAYEIQPTGLGDIQRVGLNLFI